MQLEKEMKSNKLILILAILLATGATFFYIKKEQKTKAENEKFKKYMQEQFGTKELERLRKEIEKQKADKTK